MSTPVAAWCIADADAFALVVNCFIAGMTIEILISGMSFNQPLSSRLLSIPINILIAWPNGRYRDFLIATVRHFSHGQLLLCNLADLLVYVSVQSPVYAAILCNVGADGQQIVAAVTSNTLISMAMGVFYGYMLEYCHKLFRVVGYV